MRTYKQLTSEQRYHISALLKTEKKASDGKRKVHGIPLEYIWILGSDGDKELECWLLGWPRMSHVKWGSSNRKNRMFFAKKQIVKKLHQEGMTRQVCHSSFLA